MENKTESNEEGEQGCKTGRKKVGKKAKPEKLLISKWTNHITIVGNWNEKQKHKLRNLKMGEKIARG